MTKINELFCLAIAANKQAVRITCFKLAEVDALKLADELSLMTSPARSPFTILENMRLGTSHIFGARISIQ